ncbi:hypothetical protein F5Y06DRAFT_293555 [Hypoxylon sp. FL0890]|nr:hypothetical protein F5Y06DRAFT_293555 [Hypoxylon sp. FL0890]
MIFTRILQFLSFMALAAFVAADGATCQTSAGSPWAADCKNALDALQKDVGRIGNEDCEVTDRSCKVDLCFNGKTGDGAVRKDHVVDIGNKLLAAKCGRYAVDGEKAGLKVGGYWTMDNPRELLKGDIWCTAPKESSRVQFSKA